MSDDKLLRRGPSKRSAAHPLMSPVRLTGFLGGALLLVAGGALGARYLWQEVLPHMVRTDAVMARRTGNPIPVMVTAARRGELNESLGATGAVVPADYVHLTSRISARVSDISANLGDMVRQGQVLVRFETESLRAVADSAAAEVVRASAERERAAVQRDRVEGVFKQGFLAVTEVEKAQQALDSATATLEAARAKRAEASRALSYSAIASPVTGVVTQRLTNRGETPGLGAELMVIGRMNPVLVAAQISEEQLGIIRIGQPATVTFSAFLNEEFTGKVVRVDPTTSADTKTFQAFVELANNGLRLKLGLTAFVRLQRERSTALLVPSVALIYPAGPQESAVFVVEKGLARLRRVKVGGVGDGQTAIVDGLAEGDRVVTVGQLNLRDGDKVRLGNEDTETNAPSEVSR